MTLYINALVKILDQEDKNWRKDTIILHDGAQYAQSTSITSTLKELRVPYMVLAPHSYNVAPIEILFGAIKTNNLNPYEYPTGKS